MSDELIDHHYDNHVARYQKVIGIVEGRSTRYPTCWEVRWRPTDPRIPECTGAYNERFLTVVRKAHVNGVVAE